MGRSTGPHSRPPTPRPIRRFPTIDKGFEHEHNVEKLTFGVVVLETANNQMPSYERLLEDLIGQIRSVSAGQVVRVKDPER